MLEILTSDALPARHGFFTRKGGASSGIFAGLNCGTGSSDQAEIVAINRARVAAALDLAPAGLVTVNQVHSPDVVAVTGPLEGRPKADAMVTATPGLALAILTADCLPVVFAAKDGSEIAAAHAGWPGLSKGMLEAALSAMRTPAADVAAWIGPAAGPLRYEVGRNVFDAFVANDAGATVHFTPTREGHWLADLPALARRRLVSADMALADIHGGDLCTISDPARFFSHRRDGRSGRIATLAWMARTT